jgi:hypothetical protein
LKGGRGVALVCRPNCFKLRGNSSVRVTVTLFNVTSGRFRDRLRAEVSGLEPVYFPIDIAIQGSPLVVSRSQLNVDFSGKIPICNLGKFMQGAG